MIRLCTARCHSRSLSWFKEKIFSRLNKFNPNRVADEQIAGEREVNEEMLEESVPPALTMCSCGSEQRDEQMLLCQHCGHEQHLPCYKLLPGDPLPSWHCCLPCSLQGEGRVCTDAKLGKIAAKKGLGSSVLGNTMLFRRVLALLRFCNTVSRECLQELGLTDDRINSIEEKLFQDGIVQEGGQVDGRVLEEVVQKRFGRKASKRSRDDEEVETMLRRATIEEVAGPSGDKRRGDGGGQGGAGTGAGHCVDENQLTGGGDGGQEQGKERKRRRVSRTRGE